MVLEIDLFPFGGGGFFSLAKGNNASTEAWVDIIPDIVLTSMYDYVADAADNIYSGKGYWLYSNSAGVIVP